MSDRITKLREDFDIELKAVNTDEDAKALRDRWVGQGMATGKKGLILAEMKMLGSLSPEKGLRYPQRQPRSPRCPGAGAGPDR